MIRHRNRESKACWLQGASFGALALAVVAGPCAIESREQAFIVAEHVHRAGAQFFRGGAYKPRTPPYAFQGLGLDALKIMAERQTVQEGKPQ